MTLCPYKWFLYVASVWAVIYLMIAAVPNSPLGEKAPAGDEDVEDMKRRRALLADESDDESDYE